MVTSEREMVRKDEQPEPATERFTSLQPAYEDSVSPNPEEDWEYED
jgi:hypothetical protein